MANNQPFFLDNLLKVLRGAYSREGSADNNRLDLVASIDDKK